MRWRNSITADRIGAIADEIGFELNEDEREEYADLVSDTISGFGDLLADDLGQSVLTPASLADRDDARRPSEDENPSNEWLTRFELDGESDGPLDGVTVGLKDSIAVAGYELTAGSQILEGFVPQIDAAVTIRLLEAGAHITGKLNMESFAWSGTGDISDFGAVTNPHDDEYLAGGSSSGAGAAPVNGTCDVALGTDQAGSIRIPSSWCGLVGLKPTHGLVPYTGIIPLEYSLDHVGPMAESVRLVARTLDAIAGVFAVDGVSLDPRQPSSMPDESYGEAISSSSDGRSIAVLEEGFAWDGAETAVTDAVERAIDVYESIGVSVERVRVPEHERELAAWAPIAIMGGVRVLRGGGVGTTLGGWSWMRLARTLDARLDSRADELPPSVKRAILANKLLEAEYGLEPYAKARRRANRLRRAYDEVLAEHDALVLPTTITRAIETRPDRTRFESVKQSPGMAQNTCQFNLTGHPAVSVPCAKPDGRPVGMMLVGNYFDEVAILELAASFESATEWETK